MTVKGNPPGHLKWATKRPMNPYEWVNPRQQRAFSRCAERGIEIELGFESRQLSKESPSMTPVQKNFQRNFSHAALAARPAKVSAVDNKSRGGFDLPPHA